MCLWGVVQWGRETAWFKMLRCWGAWSLGDWSSAPVQIIQKSFSLSWFSGFWKISPLFSQPNFQVAIYLMTLTKLCDFTFKIIIRTVPFRDHSCYCLSLKDYSSLFLIHHLKFCFKCFFLGSVTFWGFSSSEIIFHNGKYRAVNRNEISRVLQTA